ncbi:hypothetical protein CMMCAS05_05805 [Clavibacter michiganensis subsp. michiganensis]|nr:hypothetical protein CMMCAS05_05805 [Clavibacter michiganensis subsp. michiganensis]
MAISTPIAHAKPSARLPESSASSSVMRLSATVPPLAAMAGPALVTAVSIAAWRSSWRVSSSR